MAQTGMESVPEGRVQAAAEPGNCRVRIGDTLVRVITGGSEYKKLRDGQEVSLGVRDIMVFEDDGLLEQMLQIQT